MNMFLHNVNYNKVHIAEGNIFLGIHFDDDKPFDVIVMEID